MSERVKPEDACPRCGEARMDKLVWTDDDTETIRCATCGRQYRITEKGAQPCE